MIRGPVTAFAWLRAGAVDPLNGSRWPAEWPRRRGSTDAPAGVRAYGPEALALAIDEELWVVEVRDVRSAEPAGAFGSLPPAVGPLVAREGRLVRRIAAWTPELATVLANEFAVEARARVLRSVRDAETVLEQSQTADLRISPPAGSSWAPAPEPASARQVDLAVRAAGAQLETWWRARRSIEDGANPAAAFAEAAARCRAEAARIYAEGLGAEATDPAEAASLAYREERHRQTRLLRERLGVDPVVHAVAA